MRHYMFLVAVLLFHTCAFHIVGERTCGTHDPTRDEIVKITKAMKTWTANNGYYNKRNEIKTIQIETYWNSITKNRSKGAISETVVRESIGILNTAFSPYFKFTLAADPVTKFKSSYWGIEYYSDSELDMRDKLRRGGCGALNIYSTYTVDSLGWATLPHDCAKKKSNDGVVILYSTVPGGSRVG